MVKETQHSSTAKRSAKLNELKKKQAKALKQFNKVAGNYKEWANAISLKDLQKFMDTESEALMRVAKNKSMVVDGKPIPIDDGMVLSLLYKSAGIDIIRQYLKSKLNS